MEKEAGSQFSALSETFSSWRQNLTFKNVALFVSLATCVAFFASRKGRTFSRLFRRDMILLGRFVRLRVDLRSIRDNTTIGAIFTKTVARHPDKPLFVTKNKIWTFQEGQDFSNRVANYFSQLGYGKGDVVSLLMENRPEYVLIWLGLSRIGVITSLINTNLRSKVLAHSITVTESKAVIFSPSMASNLNSALAEISEKIPNICLYSFGKEVEGIDNHTPIDDSVTSASPELPSYKGEVHDQLMYIFTSGTTGLPKAAIIKQMRYIQVGYSMTNIMQITRKDTFYLYMPFYHAAAAILGTSQCLMEGSTGAVALKFSASKFWDDCIEFNVTITQYIGEICRYLLAQPQKPQEKEHKVRLMIGNGLRKEIWNEFKSRFDLESIIEIYGSTEGTTSLANIDNTVGAVGFFPLISKLLGRILPINIIKVDPITGIPERDKNGLCITCAPGEVGEIVAVIRNRDPLTKFDGYADKNATAKKIYTDCFRKGDRVFSSGDLVYKDENGYIYFKDRTGDTFRWKGENVATTEVESVIGSILNQSSVASCVFGVQIPGTEGRAGMVVLSDPEKVVDVNELLPSLITNLPMYAIPVFIRITSKDDITGTYKLSKVNYMKNGYDLKNCHPDPVYFLDIANKKYIPIDEDLLKKINSQSVRL